MATTAITETDRLHNAMLALIRTETVELGSDRMTRVYGSDGQDLGVIVTHEGARTILPKGSGTPLPGVLPNSSMAFCLQMLASEAGDIRLSDAAYAVFQAELEERHSECI